MATCSPPPGDWIGEGLGQGEARQVRAIRARGQRESNPAWWVSCEAGMMNSPVTGVRPQL